MKETTAMFIVTIIFGLLVLFIGREIGRQDVNERVHEAEMRTLSEVKRMCDGRKGTPNLLLGDEFYYCGKRGERK